eukprot:scaffold133389_cov39-Prasinocladus_malaysianus.AAC.2
MVSWCAAACLGATRLRPCPRACCRQNSNAARCAAAVLTNCAGGLPHGNFLGPYDTPDIRKFGQMHTTAATV